jgi:hypothetical protein
MAYGLGIIGCWIMSDAIMTMPCLHYFGKCLIWNEVLEAQEMLEVQQGEACQLKKIRRIKGER